MIVLYTSALHRSCYSHSSFALCCIILLKFVCSIHFFPSAPQTVPDIALLHCAVQFGWNLCVLYIFFLAPQTVPLNVEVDLISVALLRDVINIDMDKKRLANIIIFYSYVAIICASSIRSVSWFSGVKFTEDGCLTASTCSCILRVSYITLLTCFQTF